MALDLSGTLNLPYTRRVTLGLADVALKILLPAEHEGLRLDITAIAAAKLANDQTLTDGGAIGSHYQSIAAGQSGTEWIPRPRGAAGGGAALFLAGVADSAVAEITIDRWLP